MKKYFLQLLSYSLLLGALYSCNSAGALFKKGMKHAELAEYIDAVPYFEQAGQKGYSAAAVNFQIAEAYRHSNRIYMAEEYYAKALDAGENSEEAKFYYAFSLEANGKYEEARKKLDQYAKTGTDADYVKIARNEIKHIEKVDEILAEKHYFETFNCEHLNSENAEFGAVVEDNQLIFSSTRKEGVFRTTGAGFLGMYFTAYKGNLACEQGEIFHFLPEIHQANVNEGLPTFSPDGKIMIFAKGNTGEKGANTQNVHLYKTMMVGGQWSPPVALEITDYNAWESSPFFSPDGKRLYFASNRKGSYGGIDLWVSEYKSGKFLAPRNLGTAINTPGNEMFPYIADDGKLYFASDGHYGLGGLDIFAATFASKKNEKTNVKNLGLPFNSPVDDFGLIYTSDSTGMFSSNRKGGRGDDDIYIFIDKTPKTKIVNYYLTITSITLAADSSEVLLPNTKIEVFDMNENLLHSFVTNEKGQIPDKFAVKLHTDYIFVATKEDYYKKRDFFTMRGKAIPEEFLTKVETDTTLEAVIELKKIVEDEIFVLNNINFDFDKYDIRPDAAEELDQLVQILEDNPTIIIELRSHTDAVGPDDRNMKLSQNRAESTRNYLISKGIPANRMTAKGYGESQLLINTQEANEQNRRTEFKIIRINK